MKKSKSFLVLVLVFALLIQPLSFATQDDTSFKDVPNGHWAKIVIDEMSNQGIMNGLPGDIFAPSKTMSREEFSVILCRAFGLSPIYPAIPTFSDVDPSRWSYGYIEAAKPLLTGYFPTFGKATFSPTSPAYREDVAVAISKAMGFQSPNVDANQYLENKFYDADDISPGLRQDVLKVVYYKLMSGTSPYEFKPQGIIDRASAAALFSKVLKSSYVDATKDILLTVKIPTTVNKPEVTIVGKTNPGNKVYIGDENDENIILGGNEVQVTNGTFNVNYDLIGGEGTYTFKVRAVTPTGKSKELKYEVKYQTAAPVISFDKVPTVTDKPTVTLTGKVTDALDKYPRFYVNDEEKFLNWSNTFSVTVALKAGKNIITFEAINDQGKSTVIQKEITYNAQAATLKLNAYASTVGNKTFEISGVVTDPTTTSFRGTKLTIDGQEVYINYKGIFSKKVELKEGQNIIDVTLTSKAGQIFNEKIIVNLTYNAPVITFDNWVENSSVKTLSIHGMIQDNYDRSYKLYVNNEYIDTLYPTSGKANFKVNLTLKEGLNTFEFYVKNSLGKETRVIKTVVYGAGASEIQVTSPDQSEVANYVLKGIVKDVNDSYDKITVKVNGKTLSKLNYDYSFKYETVLVEGLNSFLIEAINSSGKQTQLVKEVVFSINAPALTLTVPETVSTETLKLKGMVQSLYDGNSNISLTINGVSVKVGYSGNFEYDMALNQGANQIEVVATGLKSKKENRQTFTVNFMPSKPVLFVNVSEKIEASSVALSGNVSDENGEVTLTVNGTAVVPNESGNWNYTLTLLPGDNVVEVIATNKYGITNVFTKTIVVPQP